MKIQKFQLSLVPILGITMLLVSCQKDLSEETDHSNLQVKSFGAVLDDPSLIQNVPLIISSDYASGESNNANYLDIVAAKPGGSGGGKGKGGGGSTSDVTAPTVSITSPSNGTTVSGNVTISASASDNVSVSSVSFSINGIIKSTRTTSPYSYSWDASSAASGNYSISATAKDAAGNTNTSTIVVGVNNTVIVLPPPPTGNPANHRINMPEVGYQGSEGSCVTFAVVYYGLSAEQYRKSGSSSYDFASNVLSPEFVYNQTKAGSGCGSGSSMINTLNFIYGNGSCTWQSMPYSSSNGCTTMPTTTQKSEAANYKIKGYSQVMSNDKSAIKTLLTAGHPLMFTFTADANFYNAGPGYIWNSYSTTFYGPHAVTICGYDDSKNAYLAINQWGTGWGDAGYIWIDYNFFATVTGSAYTLNL